MIKETLSERSMDFLVLLFVIGIAVVGWIIGFCLSLKRKFRGEK